MHLIYQFYVDFVWPGRSDGRPVQSVTYSSGRREYAFVGEEATHFPEDNLVPGWGMAVVVISTYPTGLVSICGNHMARIQTSRRLTNG